MHVYYFTALSSISTVRWLLLAITIAAFNGCLSISMSDSASSSPSVSTSDLATSISGSSSSSNQQRTGLSFLIEPPSRVHFLNETGAVIPCKVTGIQPIRVWWSLSDGTAVSEIHGLRMIRPNGDLVLSPFAPSLFRQDVHSAVSENDTDDGLVMTNIFAKTALSMYGYIIGSGNHSK